MEKEEQEAARQDILFGILKNKTKTIHCYRIVEDAIVSDGVTIRPNTRIIRVETVT